MLLTGCGTTGEDQKINSQQPHKKLNRTIIDWTWNVDAKISVDGNGLDLTTFYFDNIPDNIKHYQLFIDTIPNKGYNGENGWEVYGADYLIEDDMVFKSLSDTEWIWELKGFINLVDNKKDGSERAISILDSKLLERYIKSDKVNIYIETYDENWTGEYSTIPLPDIKIDKNTDNPPGNILGLIETDSTAQVALSADNNIAYLADGKDGLKVVDVSNPKQLSVIGTLNTTGDIKQISLSSDDTKAFVLSTSENQFFQIIDITNPKQPKSLSTISIENANVFRIVEDKVYILTYKYPQKSSYIQVIDISQVNNPIKIQNIKLPKFASTFVFSKDANIIYALSYTDIQIIDFKDKSTPKLLSVVSTGRSLENIAISNDGNIIYVVGSEGEKGGFIVNVKDPETPIVVDTIDTWSSSEDIALSPDGNNAYITNGNLQIWDISNPKEKLLIESVNIPSSANDIIISSDGTKAYISSGSIGYKHYFQVVDISSF
jgi:hypothetical protein